MTRLRQGLVSRCGIDINNRDNQGEIKMLGIELIRRILDFIQQLLRRYRTRRQLRDLDDHLLKDIGISRHQAQLESEKPFWRA
ncbi:MAG: DUF1127 domain-containing protein [Motiliproteus sp.]|nr:DUF1127 domain-containing protein [Motiliproteus sp.]MCW9051670.1 DUF1127 domain-containing protein [Motiliproteus sp.]